MRGAWQDVIKSLNSSRLTLTCGAVIPSSIPSTFPGLRLTKADLLFCPVIDLKPRLWTVIRSKGFSALPCPALAQNFPPCLNPSSNSCPPVCHSAPSIFQIFDTHNTQSIISTPCAFKCNCGGQGQLAHLKTSIWGGEWDRVTRESSLQTVTALMKEHLIIPPPPVKKIFHCLC